MSVTAQALSVDQCRHSKREDGGHGWLVAGESQLTVCDWCGELRGSIDGALIARLAALAAAREVENERLSRRSVRNRVARALMEGYSETFEWYRFALDSAELALAAVPDGWAKIDGQWALICTDEILVDLPELQRLDREAGARSCRQCGCTDAYGCEEGCWWADFDLCSSCYRAAFA